MVFLILTTIACQDEDKLPYSIDEVIGNQGAFVRNISVSSGEFNLNDIPSSSFGIQLEAWDAQNGSLLQSLDVTVEFVDNTPDNGENPVDQTFIETFDASAFTIDSETGLPNIDLNYNAEDVLDILGLSNADLDGGDIFRFEWTLNLTNGKSFNRTNSSSSLPGWPFYNAPFLLDVSVICLVDETFATGTYVVSQQTDGLFGGVWGDDDITVEVTTVPDFSTRRQFEAVYLPQFAIGNGPQPVQFDLVCGRTASVNEQPSGLQCTAGLRFGPADSPGSFVTDEEIVLTIKENIDSDCGAGPVDVTFVLTKQ